LTTATWIPGSEDVTGYAIFSYMINIVPSWRRISIKISRFAFPRLLGDRSTGYWFLALQRSVLNSCLYFIVYMGYDSGSDSDPNSSIFSRMSGKELGIIVVGALIGGFFAVQAMFGFPIKDVIIRKEITGEARVVLKDNQGTCIVEGSDQEPRTIPNCPYKIGDKLIITFKQGTVPIEKYRIKEWPFCLTRCISIMQYYNIC